MLVDRSAVDEQRYSTHHVSRQSLQVQIHVM
jgi:hypothetical protein